jgi:hypothetical protein
MSQPTIEVLEYLAEDGRNPFREGWNRSMIVRRVPVYGRALTAFTLAAGRFPRSSAWRAKVGKFSAPTAHNCGLTVKAALSKRK